MCYRLKRAIMKGIIAGKQKKQPFDYAAGENFTINGDEDWTVNNSYYFSAHDPVTGESLYCRLGVRSVHSEVWFCYSKGDKVYVHEDMIYTSGSPLKVAKTCDKWGFSYSGVLNCNGESVRAEFSGEFTASDEAVDFFCHMPAIRTATAMAGEKWNKTFFSEVRKNNQVHYEQYGRLTGTISLDGVTKQIDLPCTRDHSFGKRDWNYMNNHLWLMAVSDGWQINFSMVSYPAMSLIEVGNVKSPGMPMAYILSADYDRRALLSGDAIEGIEVKLKLTDGRTISVKANTEHYKEYIFQGGEYRLIEGVGNFVVDGEKLRGNVEVGFNREKGRFFNGKGIEELKF